MEEIKNKTIEDYIKLSDKLMKEKLDLKKEVDSLKIKLEISEKENNELETQYGELSVKYNYLGLEKNELVDKLENAEVDLQAVREKKDELEKENEELKHDLFDTTQLTAEGKVKVQAFDDVIKANKEYRKEIAALKVRINELEQEQNHLHNCNIRLRQQLDDCMVNKTQKETVSNRTHLDKTFMDMYYEAFRQILS